MNKDLIIKQASATETVALNRYLPTNIPNFHENKIQEQDSGNSVWLIAWKGEIPVGHLQLRWNGANIEKVKSLVGETPHIEAVGVNEEYRRQGIGTKLTIRAIELAIQRGCQQIGLAVGVGDNPYAREMYEKLGFKDWKNGEVVDSWEIVNAKGEKETESEVCVYLIKKLV